MCARTVRCGHGAVGCVCVERSAHCVACEAWRAKCCVRRVLRRVRRGRRVGRRRARGGGGLSCPLRRAASARCGCAGARWRAEARNVLRAKRGAQSVVCVVCYALCGAMGARAGSECEAAVGRGVRCIAARGALWLRRVCACDEQTARNVADRSAREADGAQRAACVVCCAPCGAVGARAGSECEVAAGWRARCVTARRRVVVRVRVGGERMVLKVSRARRGAQSVRA